MINGVFQPQQGDKAVQFRERVLTDADIQWVQARIRQRVLRWFTRQTDLPDRASAYRHIFKKGDDVLAGIGRGELSAMQVIGNAELRSQEPLRKMGSQFS